MGTRFAFLVTAFLAVSGSAAIAAETYTAYLCTFVIRGMGGEQTKAVIAIGPDGKAHTYETKPGSEQPYRVPVKVRGDGPDHYNFLFNLTTRIDGSSALATIQMRVPKAGGKSRATVTWRGYYGNPGGNGTCTVERNVRLPA